MDPPLPSQPGGFAAALEVLKAAGVSRAEQSRAEPGLGEGFQPREKQVWSKRRRAPSKPCVKTNFSYGLCQSTDFPSLIRPMGQKVTRFQGKQVSCYSAKHGFRDTLLPSWASPPRGRSRAAPGTVCERPKSPQESKTTFLRPKTRGHVAYLDPPAGESQLGQILLFPQAGDIVNLKDSADSVPCLCYP